MGKKSIQIRLCCHPSNHITREDYIANYITEVILLQYLALKTLSLTYFVFVVLHVWLLRGSNTHVVHKLLIKTRDGKMLSGDT